MVQYPFQGNTPVVTCSTLYPSGIEWIVMHRIPIYITVSVKLGMPVWYCNTAKDGTPHQVQPNRLDLWGAIPN